MCFDPATMAAMAASAALSAGGGMIARNEAQDNANAVAAARNRVLDANLAKQKVLSDQSRGLLDSTVAKYAPDQQGQQLDKAQADRTDTVTQNITPASTGADIPLSGSAPNVVSGEIAKRMLTAFQGATDRAKASSKLGGYNDTWFNNQTGNADANRNIGVISNFAQGNNAILPAEQDLAEIAARKQPSIWGPLLQAGGNIVAAGAGRGMFGGTSTPLATQWATNPFLAQQPTNI